MAPRWTRWQLGAAIVTALMTAACSDSLSTGNAILPNGAADDIGATARDEVEAAVSALTLPSSVDPLGTAQAPTAYSPGCVTPSTPADSDGDGVPDDAIYLFTAPPCRFTGWRGGTLDIVGQLRVQDPAPAQAGFGYEGTLTGLRTRFTTADNKIIYDVTRNGTRVLSGSVSSLLLSTDLQVIRTFAGQARRRHRPAVDPDLHAGAVAPDQHRDPRRDPRLCRDPGLDPRHRALRAHRDHANAAALQQRLYRHGAAVRRRRDAAHRHLCQCRWR